MRERAERRRGARRVLPAPVWPRMRTARGREELGGWEWWGASSVGRMVVVKIERWSAGERV